ncbi:MAG: hypothetical protein LBW85_01760 [Deltaproteobacteria bacterium]|jgi:exopolyphosphatase/guanosine-5'-triphosphate,3'-diphosphate pyrophosphatase|nr:hypothetical protein [Deltaproteobacteria bacterium]
MSGLYAALDLGSNTFRLLLAETLPGGAGLDRASKRIWQEIPRISEGLAPGSPFQAEPLRRAWKVLEGFAATAAEAKPLRTLACATMAARLASDGEEFVQGLRDRFGWEAEILRGEEEARLAALGALAGFADPPPRSVVFDVGGRSTEFIAAEGRTLGTMRSLNVGVVALKEAFIANDPPLPEELQALEGHVRAALLEAPDPGNAAEGSGEAGPVLIGTAGTVTTLAAMLLGLPRYLPEKVHGAELSRESLEALYRKVSRQGAGERASWPSLHPLRSDVITGGLALALGILSRYGADRLVASDDGLLEGVWLAAAGAADLRPSA